MKTIEQIVGENIRSRRELLGLSQAELGSLAGKISGHTIGMWEKAKQGYRTANLEAVAKALGCTREDLLKDQKNISPLGEISVIIELLELWDRADKNLRDAILNTLRKGTSKKDLDKKERA